MLARRVIHRNLSAITVVYGALLAGCVLFFSRLPDASLGFFLLRRYLSLGALGLNVCTSLVLVIVGRFVVNEPKDKRHYFHTNGLVLMLIYSSAATFIIAQVTAWSRYEIGQLSVGLLLEQVLLLVTPAAPFLWPVWLSGRSGIQQKNNVSSSRNLTTPAE